MYILYIYNTFKYDILDFVGEIGKICLSCCFTVNQPLP